MLVENLCAARLRDWVQIAAYVVAIIAAIGSWWQYVRNSKRERSRWLFDLYQRFYGDRRLKEMSARIDWGDTEFAREEADQKLCERLDEYLNFFEFIAYLKEKGQLRSDDVRQMFDYPLRMIAKDRNVFAYLSRPDYSYGGVSGLLQELGYAKDRGSKET